MEELLSGIESPADVKRLTIPQLTQLAEEIRERLILSVAKTGGHIGPNLGVVELTIAMHYVFDTPRDSFVFDVSHQAYVHKMLTGRNSRLGTIRQPGGLNGFMLRTESEHDSYGSGTPARRSLRRSAWLSREICLAARSTLSLSAATPPLPTGSPSRR